MYCLKVFIILWTCNIAYDVSVTAVVRGAINVMESKQKYCGELLDRSIEIYCIDIPRRLQFLESQKNESQIYQRDTVKRTKIRGQKHRFLQNHCCAKECSLNFIKSNCPGTRNQGHKKNNNGVIGNQPITNKTMTTARPHRKMSNKKNSTTSRPTTTRRPTTTTTTTTRRPTTTSTTTTEYYYEDNYFFVLPSS